MFSWMRELLGDPVDRHDPHGYGGPAAVHGLADLGALLGGVLAGALAEASDEVGVLGEVGLGLPGEPLGRDRVDQARVGGEGLDLAADPAVVDADLGLQGVGVGGVLSQDPRAGRGPGPGGRQAGQPLVPVPARRGPAVMASRRSGAASSCVRRAWSAPATSARTCVQPGQAGVAARRTRRGRGCGRPDAAGGRTRRRRPSAPWRP